MKSSLQPKGNLEWNSEAESCLTCSYQTIGGARFVEVCGLMICCRLEPGPQALGDSFDDYRLIPVDEKQATFQVQMCSPPQGWEHSTYKENQKQEFPKLVILADWHAPSSEGGDRGAAGQIWMWACFSSWGPCPAKALEAVPETQALTWGAKRWTLEHAGGFGLLQRKHRCLLGSLCDHAFHNCVAVGDTKMVQCARHQRESALLEAG